MNRIITIRREFGSCGRELGKQLSKSMEIVCYDREIITAIAEKSHLAQSAEYREKAFCDEVLSEKAMEKKIRCIDVDRAHYRQLLVDSKWDAKGTYQLCINTSGTIIKNLIPPISSYANCWFGEALQ